LSSYITPAISFQCETPGTYTSVFSTVVRLPSTHWPGTFFTRLGIEMRKRREKTEKSAGPLLRATPSSRHWMIATSTADEKWPPDMKYSFGGSAIGLSRATSASATSSAACTLASCACSAWWSATGSASW
jgi:hypothetical protein